MQEVGINSQSDSTVQKCLESGNGDSSAMFVSGTNLIQGWHLLGLDDSAQKQRKHLLGVWVGCKVIHDDLWVP